jgi:hypothetical protein
MAKPLFFDDEKGADGEETVAPIWSIDFENSEELLRWDADTRSTLDDNGRPRDIQTKENICRYRGYYSDVEPVIGGKFLNTEKKRFPTLVVNHSQDLVEQKVATQLKYKPSFEVSPDSLELSDKQKAEVSKKLLDSNNYQTGLVKDYHRYLRHSILAGQSWAYVYFDKNVGRSTGKTKKIRFARRDGTFHTNDVQEHVGDVRVQLVPDWQMKILPANDIYGCPGVMREYPVHISELYSLYPDIGEISRSTDAYGFSYSELRDQILRDHVYVREYYFRSNHVLDKGLYFKVCDGQVLDEPQDNPVPSELFDMRPMGNIPFARFTDVDIDGELNGFPSFSWITPLQHIYDKWITLCHRNIFLFCHPKWAYQRGSVDESRLANAALMLPYSGGQPPVLLAYQSLTQDLMAFGPMIMDNMEKVMRISSVSRGAPPPGTRAAAQLYFYDEQEQTANAVFRRKFEDFTVDIETLKLCLMSQNYKKSDKRLVYTLGKNKTWLAESLDISALGERQTVRIRSASNLPDSKFARIQAFLDIYAQAPQMITQEMFFEILEFGQQEALIDYARQASLTAQSENELLMSGKKPQEPMVYENHLTHWKEHNKIAQDPNFKNQPKEVQTWAEEHIGGHEFMMLAIGTQNPVYKQTLMQLPQFPLFASLPPPTPVPMGMPPGAEGPPPGGAPPGMEGAPPGGEAPPQGPEGPPPGGGMELSQEAIQKMASSMSQEQGRPQAGAVGQPTGQGPLQ